MYPITQRAGGGRRDWKNQFPNVRILGLYGTWEGATGWKLLRQSPLSFHTSKTQSGRTTIPNPREVTAPASQELKTFDYGLTTESRVCGFETLGACTDDENGAGSIRASCFSGVAVQVPFDYGLDYE